MKISALAGVTDRALPQAGLDVRRIRYSVRRLPGFVRDARTFRRQCIASGITPPSIADYFPFLNDAGETAGATSGHYFLQDLWAARRIFNAMPGRHYDVGSRVDGFVSSLLVYCDVTVVDLRPLPPARGLSTVMGDATSLPFRDRSVRSLSSLHAMEHVGLGRYGDPIDANGTQRAMAELARVLAPGGNLYFAVPIGAEKTVFNAHRILSPYTPIEAFSSLELTEFSAIDDRGTFIEGCEPGSLESAHYACGLYEFRKPS
jgi:SAM-dependent methyltransferase